MKVFALLQFELKLIRRQYYFILMKLNPRAPRRGQKSSLLFLSFSLSFPFDFFLGVYLELGP